MNYIGYRCETCFKEFNSFEDNPKCCDEISTKLNQIVPFKANSGLPPDYEFYCVCGKVFQHIPQDFNPLIKEKVIITCPFCSRKSA